MNQAVALSQSFINNSRNIDADSVLSSIVDLLFADQDYADPEGLAIMLDALSAIAPCTWYFCECGPISPLNGEIDAVCNKCGALRRLPERLPFPLWTAYIMTVRRVFPDDWHTRMCKWAADNHLLNSDNDQNDVLVFIDGMKIQKDGRTIGTNWIALPLPSFSDITKIV